jgi:hypothetical protein
MESLLDIGLDGRGGEGASERRLVKNFPGSIHLVLGLVNGLHGFHIAAVVRPEEWIRQHRGCV